MAAFRLGLVGAGRMGRTHLRAIAGSELVTIAAVAEPSAQARHSLAEAGLPLHASVSAMLDRSGLDGVLIAAPSDQHARLIGEVAARGVPILCEKPCGLSSTEASAAAQAAAAAGVPLQVAYSRRFVPALQAVRDRIAAGELGGIHLVSCYQWDEGPPAAAFRAHSGGIAIDMGVHEFDQLRWLTGQDITDVKAVAAELISDPGVAGDVDSAQIIMALSAGAAGFVSLGRHHPAGDMARAEVFGTAGTIRCDFLDPADGERAQLDALRRQAEGFAAVVSGGAGSGYSGATADDAVAALRAAEQVSAAIPALAGADMSGRDADAVARVAKACGVPDHVTDWRALIGRDDVDLVDICTPPGTHAEIAQAAAAAGKAVFCEKPLATSYAQAMDAVTAVESVGVHNAVGFNYRRLPAVALMRRMIADGVIGEVRLWRARWLSDEFTDPETPYDWRFDRAMGGTTIADLGSHLLDMAAWMAGPVTDVCAQSETFITERQLPGGGSEPVTVDDASSALVRFASGARGTVEMARSAVRRPCDFTVEFNGSGGTLVFDYARLNELWFGDGGDDPGLYGMRRIRAEHPTHPYAAQWWPIGQGSATARASRTRQPTCSRDGRRNPGRPASARRPACRRSAPRWRSRRHSSDGWR